jgi:DNA (cytosine-5)-methyltransferase 1
MIRLATLFSGIGAIEQAFEKMNIEHEIVFACDNGERELSTSKEDIEKSIEGMNFKEKKEYIDNLYDSLSKPNYMEISYLHNYKLDKKNFHQDIRFLDGNQYKNQVDLLVGGSPCQSFSIIGKRGGFNDTRGTLFYEYARIINEVQPKAFIFENVRGMLNHDKGKTWETVKNTFEELNYKIYIRKNPILNAKDYGIPQNRPRLFVIGIRNDLDTKEFIFPNEVDLSTTVKDYLDKNVDSKYYLGKKGFEFVTNPKYKNRAQINSKIMSCQKANQQFNWNGEFVFIPYEEINNNEEVLKKAYISTYNGQKGVCRKLTPQECVRLMGFSNKFEFPKEIPDVDKYRQAGNSIVVNVFEYIIPQLIKTNVFEKNNNVKLNKIRLATLFSGIGAVEQALIRNHTPYEIVFACDNGDIDVDYNHDEEFKKIQKMNNKLEKKQYVDSIYLKSRKQNYVKQSYMANYGDKIKEEDFHYDINLLDGTDYRNQVDLLVGGSPCQSFSTVGFKKGLEDARGTLFYEYARIIKEVNPKVFIYENVRGLTTHDHGNTWGIMKGIFKSLNYTITEPQILNAANYGIPQNRRRIFVIGIRNDIKLKRNFEYPKEIPLNFSMKQFLESNCEYGNFCYDINGNLIVKESNFDPSRIDDKYVLSNLVRKYVLTPGTKTFRTQIKYDLDIARTVLSTMGNRHRAGVDNYMSDKGGEDKLRMLTEREALRLMGFPDDFKIVVSRAQMYKQAGNSIVVDVMLAVVKEIIKTGVFEG